MDAVPPGTLLYRAPPAHERRDSKSGALILDQLVDYTKTTDK
jgi:hypothetical protein